MTDVNLHRHDPPFEEDPARNVDELRRLRELVGDLRRRLYTAETVAARDRAEIARLHRHIDRLERRRWMPWPR